MGVKVDAGASGTSVPSQNSRSHGCYPHLRCRYVMAVYREAYPAETQPGSGRAARFHLPARYGRLCAGPQRTMGGGSGGAARYVSVNAQATCDLGMKRPQDGLYGLPEGRVDLGVIGASSGGGLIPQVQCIRILAETASSHYIQLENASWGLLASLPRPAVPSLRVAAWRARDVGFRVWVRVVGKRSWGETSWETVSPHTPFQELLQ
jgi:hypothetical protein